MTEEGRAAEVAAAPSGGMAEAELAPRKSSAASASWTRGGSLSRLAASLWSPTAPTGGDSIEPDVKVADQEKDAASRADLCWLHPPAESWSLRHYATVEGCEQLQLYLWLAKDLSWMRLAWYPGVLAGSAASAVQLCILGRALWLRNAHEATVQLCQTGWLGANFWWMLGELHDHEYGFKAGGTQWYARHNAQAGWLLDSSLIVCGLYSLLLRPMGWLPAPSEAARKPYKRALLRPRRVVRWALRLSDGAEQSDWRVYENMHLFFWLGKDSAWAHFDTGDTPARRAVMWILFAVPTISLSVDFLVLSVCKREGIVEHAHYVAAFLWVSANIAWAAGELWGDAYHDAAVGLVGGPLPVSSNSDVGESYSQYVLQSGRWWSAWLCISAYVPLAVLLAIWWVSSALRCARVAGEEAAAGLSEPLLAVESEKS